MVTDCKAVVTGFDGLVSGKSLGWRTVHGGFWKEVKEAGCVRGVVKVKSHLSAEGSEACGQAMHHNGNAEADRLAGDAAKAYDEDEMHQHVDNQKKRVTQLVSVVKWLAQQKWTDWGQAGKAPRAMFTVRPGGTKDRHLVQWLPGRSKWRCLVCGCTSGSPTLGTKACPGKLWLEGVQRGHDLHLGTFDDGGLIAHCVRCGQYRTAKGQGLLKGCGHNVVQRCRVRRLREGRHPKEDRSFKRSGRVPDWSIQGGAWGRAELPSRAFGLEPAAAAACRSRRGSP